MQMDRRFNLLDKLIAYSFEHKQFEQALANIAFFYRQQNPQTLTDLHLAKVQELVGTCLKGLTGQSCLTETVPASAKQQVLALFNVIGEQVGQLVNASAYEHALPLARQAVKFGNEIVGHNAPELTVHLMNLGVLYDSMENYPEAEKTLERGLVLAEAALAESDLRFQCAWFALRLGSVYLKQGNAAKARACMLKAQTLFTVLSTTINDPQIKIGKALADQMLQKMSVEIDQKALQKSLIDESLIEVRQEHSDVHERTGYALLVAGKNYLDVGNVEEAEKAYQEAVSIMMKLYSLARSGDTPEEKKLFKDAYMALAAAWNGLATVFAAQGRFNEAEALLQRILSARPYPLSPKNALTANVLNNLGLVYQLAGEYGKAKLLVKQTIEINQTLHDSPNSSDCAALSNLAMIHKLLGEYAESELLFKQASELIERTQGASSLKLAKVLDNFGTLYEAMGNYLTARTMYSRALDIFLGGKKLDLLQGGDVPPVYANDVVICLNNLGNAYHQTGNLAEATLFYRHAIQICRETLGEKHPIFTVTISNLASLHRTTGNYVEAWDLFEKVLEVQVSIYGPQSAEIANTYNGLATLLTDIGKYAEAQEHYQKALNIAQVALGENHPVRATYLDNFAAFHMAMGEPQHAFEIFKDVQAIRDQNISMVFSIGSESQRLDYLNSIRVSLYAVLTLVSRSLVSSPDAIRFGMELTLRRKALGADAMAMQRFALMSGKYPHLKPTLQELMTLRMRLAQETLRGPGRQSNEEYRGRLAELAGHCVKLETDLARSIPETSLKQQFERIDCQAVADALPEETAVIEIVRHNVFDYRSAPERGAPLWQPTITRRLGIMLPNQPGQRWQGAQYLAFVLHAGDATNIHMVNLGDADLIDRLVKRFRTLLTGESETAEVNAPIRAKANNTGLQSSDMVRKPREAESADFQPLDEVGEDLQSEWEVGKKLRTILFDALLPALGNCSKLLIAPDGDLSRLPFEVLPTDDGARLIDRYAISYLSAARDVLRFNAELRAEATAPLVVANPDFDLASDIAHPAQSSSDAARYSRDLDRGSLHFSPLDGTQVEGDEVARLLNTTPFVREQATENRIKAHASPRILHIATHGFFLSDMASLQPSSIGSNSLPPLAPAGAGQSRRTATWENPLLRSGLALAGANTWLRGKSVPFQAQDGILTAEDVTGLDLLGTELVVLSACETGLGQIQIGEGVFGLRRAFILAGARTLVMSLWKVPDQQTQELMVDFYRRLLAGQPRAMALRNAQIELKKKYSSPRYWGAFICQGFPGTLPG